MCTPGIHSYLIGNMSSLPMQNKFLLFPAVSQTEMFS